MKVLNCLTFNLFSLTFSLNMRSFLKILIDVLFGVPEIAELPEEKLIGISSEDGQFLNRPVPEGLILKLARLQTMAINESKKGEIPDNDSSSPHEGAQFLAIKEDATRRVIMIEQLIVEAVRECFPTEYDRLDVTYFVNQFGQIMYRPVSRQLFLD